MKLKIILLTVAVIFSAASVHAALNMKDMMDRGNLAYEKGQYREAAAYYRIVLTSLQKNRDADPIAVAYVRYCLGTAQLLNKEPAKAMENIEGLYRLQPDRPGVCRAYGSALFFNKRYKDAIPVLEKSIALENQTAGEAYYRLGLSRLFTGDPAGAKTELRKVGELAPRSAEAQNAEKVLAGLEKLEKEITGMEKQAAVTAAPGKPTKEKPWAVSLSLGMEYDSNVGLIPSEQTRPEDISSTSDWRAVHSLSGVYEFVNTGKQFAGIGGGVYGTNQIKDSEFNVENGALNLYYKINVADAFQFRVSPFVSKSWLSAASHNLTWGVTPGVSYQPVRWTWTDLDYTFAKAQFSDGPQYPEENRNGTNHTFALKQNFSFPSLLLDRRSTYFGVWGFYGKSDTDGTSYDNDSYGAGIQAQQEFPWDLAVLMTYVYGRTRFENPNIRSAASEKRDDTNHLVSATAFKRLPMVLKNLSAYAGWRWYKNDSNIERFFSYSSNTYSLGLILDF